VLQPVSGARRVNSSPKEGLVGVNISHTGDPLLVHQDLLDCLAAALDLTEEPIQIEFIVQWLGSDARSIGPPLLLIQQPDGSQSPDVAVHESCPIAYRSQENGVTALFGCQATPVDRQDSGHSGLNYHPEPVLEQKHSVFCSSRNRGDLLAPD
jgi:hypothetical protein